MAEHVSRRCEILFVNTNANVMQLDGNNTVAFRKNVYRETSIRANRFVKYFNKEDKKNKLETRM